MTIEGAHPQDFGSCLDRRVGDPGHDELRAHLESCEECRRETDIWQSVEALFRSPELELALPPFQWQRIAARIEAECEPLPWHVRFGGWLRPRTAALGVAFSSLIFMALTYAGLGYRSFIERQQLAELQEYARAEQATLGGLENPFRKIAGDETLGSNPFTPYQEDDGNPFNVR